LESKKSLHGQLAKPLQLLKEIINKRDIKRILQKSLENKPKLFTLFKTMTTRMNNDPYKDRNQTIFGKLPTQNA
jgi:hypothetical protein